MSKRDIFIAPAAARAMTELSSDLREKIKNALRGISSRETQATELGPHRSLTSKLGRANGGRKFYLYKAGRFQIIFHRRNGSVWVDALTVAPPPLCLDEASKGVES